MVQVENLRHRVVLGYPKHDGVGRDVLGVDKLPVRPCVSVRNAAFDGEHAAKQLRPQSPETIMFLTGQRGWSPDKYRQWLASALISELLPAELAW
jgi:hypothetical protein